MKSIEGLRREVTEKNLPALSDYLRMKDIELENLKLNVKISHVNKVNGICQHENDGWIKIASQASTIIQENYLLLRSSGDLDNGMKDKLTQLLKMIQGERNVKFLDESSPPVDIFELNLCDWRDDMGKTPQSQRKRANDLSDSVESSSKKSKRSSSSNQFLRPKAVKSINFAGALQPQSDHDAQPDLNVTFDAGSSTSTKVLADKGNRIGAASTLRGELRRDFRMIVLGFSYSCRFAAVKPTKTSSKFTLNINKENKKFSPTSRIKKTQRTPVRVPGGRGELGKFRTANKGKLTKDFFAKFPADHRPKLVKAAVTSALVAPTSREKLKIIKK